MVTSEIEKRIEHPPVKVNERSYILTKDHAPFIFEANRFEKQNDKVIKQGIIELELVVLCSKDEVVKCGITCKAQDQLE